MKKVIILFTILTVMIYLMISFILFSFNIVEWGPINRLVFVVGIFLVIWFIDKNGTKDGN